MKNVYQVTMWNPGLYGTNQSKENEVKILVKNIEKAKDQIQKYFDAHLGGFCRVLPHGLGYRKYFNLRMEHYFNCDELRFNVSVDWTDYKDVNCEHEHSSKEDVWIGKVEPVMFNEVIGLK